MATIPIGNFGQAVARAVPQINVPRGDPLGQAVERTGQVASNVLTDMAAQETRRQHEAMIEQQRKDDAVREAALRAKTINVLGGAKDALTDLHDEIGQGVLDGTVPKEKAQVTFTERAKKALEGVGADLPEERRATILAELERDAARLENGVRKVVTQRDRQDVTAGITTTLEQLQREYRTNPAQATKRATDIVDRLGPHSTLNPDQLVRLKQGWKEGTQYTAGYELVSAARNDRQQLDAAEQAINAGLPDLDPQKRATLLDRISAYRLHLEQKADMASARAQRDAERRMKHAEAEFNAFQALADKGTVLDPAYIDRAVTVTTGTPYQAGIVALAQQARDMGGLAAQPVTAQQRLLDQVNAQIATQGRSAALDKRKDQIEKVLRGSQQDLERDALRAGLERGVITDLRPLDFTKGMPGMVGQLRERVPLAERVGIWAGQPVSPMTENEAAQVKHQLDALPAKERSGMVAAITQVVGSQAAQGLAAQMDKKDKALALAFALAGSSTTEGRMTSELVLKGQQARADGTSTKGDKQPDVKAAGWRAHAAAELDGVFSNAQTTGQIRDAAELIMHGIAAEQGGRLSRNDMDRAVRLALGGSLIEHNGRKILLAAGVDESMLEKRLASVTSEELLKQAPGGAVRAGGVEVPIAEFVKTLPGQQLMPVRMGQYAVLVGGRPVVNHLNKPILIGVQ